MAAVVLVAFPVVSGGVGHVRAQSPGEPPTTTTTTLPTTTTPPTTAPPPAAEKGPAEPEHDSTPEPVPTDPVVIPPPPPPPPGAPASVPPAPAELAKTQQSFDQMFGLRSAAALRYQTAFAETAALEARFTVLSAERQQKEAALAEARERLKKLVVARYVATPVAPLNHALQASDVVDMSRRFALLGAASRADHRRVEDYESAARGVTDEVSRVSADLARSRAALAEAGAALQQSDAGLLASKAQLIAAQTGGIIVAGGLSFPVAGPHSFTDSFGAPRMFGTPFAHLHQGTDIFAVEGTPLVAIERGVLIRVGTDTLGGTKLWLVGATGTRYFYAHLSAFAIGVTEGKPVQAGEVVGFVGTTGNARGTSPHLHFEVHPDGGAAINPYPLLRIIDDAQQRLMPTPLPGSPGR